MDIALGNPPGTQSVNIIFLLGVQQEIDWIGL